MASLIEIRKKIQAVNNSAKITKAMQLVATSKMRFFQKKALTARRYITELIMMLDQVMDEEDFATHFFTQERKTGPTLFVVYTSDKGLCGSLNNQILRKLFKSEEWLKTPPAQRKLITIGKKAYEYARVNKIKVEKHFKGINEKLTLIDALPVIDAISQDWVEGRCKDVIFVTPHYKTTFFSYPILKTYFPISKAMVHSYLKDIPEEQKRNYLKKYLIFEPSKKGLLNSLFLQIIQAIFIRNFFELKAAEYSSRMVAMQNATEAADKIVQDLKIGYNKSRQQLITQEIAELLAGAESLVS